MRTYWSLTARLRYGAYEGADKEVRTAMGSFCAACLRNIASKHSKGGVSKMDFVPDLCFANNWCTWLSQDRVWIKTFVESTLGESSVLGFWMLCRVKNYILLSRYFCRATAVFFVCLSEHCGQTVSQRKVSLNSEEATTNRTFSWESSRKSVIL